MIIKDELLIRNKYLIIFIHKCNIDIFGINIGFNAKLRSLQLNSEPENSAWFLQRTEVTCLTKAVNNHPDPCIQL